MIIVSALSQRKRVERDRKRESLTISKLIKVQVNFVVTFVVKAIYFFLLTKLHF